MRNKITHKFPRWLGFREAVDVALSRPSVPPERYVSYTKAFDDILSNFLDSPSDVPEARQPMNLDIGSELSAVAKEITLSAILAQTPQEPYFSVAHTLRDALRQRELIPTVSADDERWIHAIQIALAYNEFNDSQSSATSTFQASHLTFAQAVQFFISKGANISLRGDVVPDQSDGVWAAISATVASPMLALGDTLAMKYMDMCLSNRFDPVVGRIRLHPTPDMMGRKMDRSLPCGHLYRTAIKALGRNRMLSRPLAAPAFISEAATHLAALYEVEPFSTYELIFPPYPTRIFEVLIGVVLYDELFTVPQCDPRQMESLMSGLFKEVFSSDQVRMGGCTLGDILEFWRLLLDLTSLTATSTFIKRSQLRFLLAQRVGIPTCEALLKVFVLSKPNRGYDVPSDANRSDTRECALVEASGDRYWIAAQPFLGPAFFARLVSFYTQIDKSVSSKIGAAFETQMLHRMKQLGIQCRRAEVVGTKGANAGDVDLILETKEIVALFELKKKGLTRKTNAGNVLQLAIDLARGVVRGVNQLARHELVLLQRGELRFTDGTKLILGGRRIVKCVISLADYGGFHDGAVIRNMLRSFSQISLNSNFPLTDKQKGELGEANDELKKLGANYSEFKKLQSDGSDIDLSDNILFHNVFFLEHLLLTAPTAELLLHVLLRTNRVVTGSRDPFFENASFT